MEISIETEHLREETILRIDRDLAKLVSQVRSGLIEKGDVALTLSAQYDDKENRVVIGYTHKSAATHKGQWGLLRPEELELPFDAASQAAEAEEAEEETAEPEVIEGQPPIQYAALGAGTPLELPEGEIIEAEYTTEPAAQPEASEMEPEAAAETPRRRNGRTRPAVTLEAADVPAGAIH